MFCWFDVVVWFAKYFRIELLFGCCFGLVFFVLVVVFGIVAASRYWLLFGLVVVLFVCVVCCVCFSLVSVFSLFSCCLK